MSVVSPDIPTRSCFDKLRRAVRSIPMDSAKSTRLQNLCSDKMSEILPNLYLASRTVSQNSELLLERRITTVINVSDREVPNYEDNHPFVKKYKFFTLSDTASSKFDDILEEGVRIIHESRKRGDGVLVHCFLGVSRSATLVAFYLILALGMNWKDAVNYVRQKRNSVNPNVGFLQQLETFSKTKANELRLNIIDQQCISMRKNDAEIIKTYMPLAVMEL